MASGTFRSNSSDSTTLFVNLYEIWRDGTTVGMRVEWLVHTGSSTALGASDANQRNLIIKHVNGDTLSEANIKNAATAWNTNSNYSGSWDFSFNCGTYNANTQSMIPSTTSTGTQSCIWTTYVSQLDVAVSEYWSACTAPTNLSHTLYPGPFENSITFTWTHGTDGINNPITDQHLYYFVQDSEEFGIAVGASTTSYTLNTAAFSRGSVVRFRIYSISAHGNPLSEWSPFFTKNRAPYAPTIGSPSVTTCLPGSPLTVSFAGNGDADGNLVGYEFATNVESDGLVATNITASPASINTTGWSQGIQRQFKVRAVDAFGVRSSWSGYSATVSFNATPNAPTIHYPIAGATVYRQIPRMLIAAGATNDGPEHVLHASADTYRSTASNGSNFSCGTQVFLASGRTVVYITPSNIGTGAKTLRAKMFDGYLYSAEVTRAINIVTPSFTDPTITPGVTPIKAVHITELQSMINNLRVAYGLASYNFASCVAGTSQIAATAFVTQLQVALQELITGLNAWDSATSTFDISVTWVAIAAVGGGVDATKFRQAIEQIRTVITQI